MVDVPYEPDDGDALDAPRWRLLGEELYAILGALTGADLSSAAGIDRRQITDRYSLFTVALPIVGHRAEQLDPAGATEDTRTFVLPDEGTEVERPLPLPLIIPPGDQLWLCAVLVGAQEIAMPDNVGVLFRVYRGSAAAWTLLGGDAVELRVSDRYYGFFTNDPINVPVSEISNGEFIRTTLEHAGPEAVEGDRCRLRDCIAYLIFKTEHTR